MRRMDVYDVIDTEREYQQARWNEHTTVSGGKHSVEEWIMYIEDYLSEAKHILSRGARQDTDKTAMGIMRKVAAMAVACMEEHGAEPRK